VSDSFHFNNRRIVVDAEPGNAIIAGRSLMNDTALMAIGQHAVDEKVTVNTAPQEEFDLGKVREEIDKLDAEILRLVQHRTRISRSIGAMRVANGGPRIVYKQEMAVLARFRGLGPEGSDLAMLLLRLGRGRPGVPRTTC
jgi:chorismate mutase